MSADDLAANLQSYQIQLQQVEAALTNDSVNEELLKLKKDLQEVILLTTELIAANTEKASPALSYEGSSTEGVSHSHWWKAGDKCMAPWSEDGQYYEALIEDITEDDQCTVNFAAYGNTDVTDLEHLRPLDKEHGLDFPEGSAKSRKQLIQAQKEYKKKKAQKKAQRMKQLEEEREKEKLKWHSFNSKVIKAFNKKGHVKKSIFASPDNINGRVGIGTCGIGGRPMTEFQQQEKWRRPMTGPHSMKNTAFKGQTSFM